MKKLFFIIIASILFNNYLIGQSGWTLQTNPLGTNTLGKIHFVSPNEGWISEGLGRFLHTTDAGLNWTLVDPFPDDSVLTSLDPAVAMCWINPTHGWTINLMTTDLTYYTGAVIYKTTDGGITWNKVILSNSLMEVGVQIQFTDENNGWSTIYSFQVPGLKIFKTTNGGNNWTELPSTGTAGCIFYFVNTTTGWRITMSPSPPYSIFKTTDGGNSWIEQYTFNGTTNDSSGFNALYFTSVNNGWVVGDFGKVLKTTDGGNNWTLLTNTGLTNDHKCNTLFFLNDNIGWIEARQQGLPPVILYTSDGGENWITQNPPVDTKLFSIFFSDSYNGWFISDDGKIGHTTTGGLMDVKEIDNGIPSEYSLFQNYPNPFNPYTNFRFQIVKEGFVSLKVFDILGNEIASVIEKEMPAGTYEIEFDGTSLSSGLYFYKLQTGNYTVAKKMVVLK